MQGQSGTVQLAVTRSAGFAQSVSVSTSGLPAGVSATVSPSPLTSAVSAATVSISVSAATEPGTYAVTVSATAAGVSGVSDVFQLTVVAAPSFILSLAPSAMTVNAGSVGTTTIGLSRTNLAGAIALSLVSPPSGISATFTPSTVTGNSAGLDIAVASTVAPGSYSLTVQGSSDGAINRSATLQLTVNAAPNFALSASSTPVAIVAGAAGSGTITVTRTNFTGDVALSLASPPTGISATFAPATTSGNSSTVTIAVASSVAAGNYNLNVAGTATSIGTRTTSLPIVVSFPAPTLSQVSPNTGVAGDTVDITLTGTGFVPGATTVAVSGAGVTVINVQASASPSRSGSQDAALLATTSLTASLVIAVDATPGERAIAVTTPGGTSAAVTFTIAAPPPSGGIVHLATGHNHTCAIRPSGEAYCFGLSSSGALGNGEFGSTELPVLVAGGHSFVQLDGGDAQTCGLTGAGAAWCWGRGTNGRLGNGSSNDQFVPVPVSGGHAFKQISAGLAHTCGVRTDGVAMCWGSGTSGQLGNGTSTTSMVPVVVAGGHAFLSVDAGPSGPQSCGVRTDGVAMCWGGLIADQPQPTSTVPVEISGGHTFSKVVFANSAVCGITTGGIVRCWGSGSSGRLGNGSTNSSSVPMPVSGDFNFVDIAGSGNAFFCGVTASGDARCWGSNINGRLGDGTTEDRNVPTLVVGGYNFVAIDAGGNHACGRTADNRAFCWGFGGQGRLGTGNSANSFTPVEVKADPFGSSPP